MKKPATTQDILQAAFEFHRLGRTDDAERMYRELLRRAPNDPRLIGLLARLRIDQKRYDEALMLADRAAAIDPKSSLYQFCRGVALKNTRRPAEAIDAFATVVSDDAKFPGALVELIDVRLKICDWTDFDRLQQLFTKQVRAGTPGLDALLFLRLSDDAADQLTCAKRVVADILQGAPTARRRPRSSRPNGRIRVGYLSYDFYDHATVHLIADLIESHDRAGFEIIGISTGRDDGSPQRQRMAAAFDQFIDALDWPLSSIADKIAQLDLDILVDLTCLVEVRHIPALARRPAPIQVNFLGYPGTSGADFYDYIISDARITPADRQPFFSEKLVLLPDCYQPNDRKQKAAERVPTRAEAKLPEDAFVFAAFNRLAKITPPVFDVWMRIMRQEPGSVLWLLRDNKFAEKNLLREAEARGITGERLVFADRASLPEHLARFQLADLFLDTFPYSAHTTASDALRVAVPVLTRAGQGFASRVAASLLHAIGAPELITHSIEEYEALAVALARDPARLKQIRSRIADNRERYPLFDTPKFCRNIEQAYIGMYRNEDGLHAAP